MGPCVAVANEERKSRWQRLGEEIAIAHEGSITIVKRRANI